MPEPEPSVQGVSATQRAFFVAWLIVPGVVGAVLREPAFPMAWYLGGFLWPLASGLRSES